MNDGAAPPSYEVASSSCYVKISYRVQVVGGPVLKGAMEPEIMDFVTGYRHVVPGLEKRLIGHSAGEKMSFAVPAEEAFGPRHKELMIEKSLNDFHFPEGMKPYPGMQLPIVTIAENSPDTVIIREVRSDAIVIDCNHPLAGVALQYDLQILEARPAVPTDVCAEWEQSEIQTECSSCSGSPAQFVLGEGPQPE